MPRLTPLLSTLILVTGPLGTHLNAWAGPPPPPETQAQRLQGELRQTIESICKDLSTRSKDAEALANKYGRTVSISKEGNRTIDPADHSVLKKLDVIEFEPYSGRPSPAIWMTIYPHEKTFVSLADLGKKWISRGGAAGLIHLTESGVRTSPHADLFEVKLPYAKPKVCYVDVSYIPNKNWSDDSTPVTVVDATIRVRDSSSFVKD